MPLLNTVGREVEFNHPPGLLLLLLPQVSLLNSGLAQPCEHPLR